MADGAIHARTDGMESVPQPAGVVPSTSKPSGATRERQTHVAQPRALLVMQLLYRPILRRAARATLQGRRIDPASPEAGRFLRADVDELLDAIWDRVPQILREEDLGSVFTAGNRHNVFLGALTVAGYHALLERGIERRYAMELFADVGWKIYERMITVPWVLAGLVTRDPQRRMNRVLRSLMSFPFSAPGRPGYEVTAWSDREGFHTHWTYCAPLGFVQRYVGRHGDRGELEAFYRSWCQYDWPAADVLAGGRAGEHGHYARPHTLSRGDSVCDMCWSAGGCKPQSPLSAH